MNSEWNMIGSVYCLNLERNTQRWIDSSIQFHNVGLYDVERINCIESLENRYLSFNKSHYDTVKKGYETGSPFAIFEDDIIFDQLWKYIAEASSQLPENWDALYLGANICGEWSMPERFSSHLSRLPNAWQSHAIIYSMKGAKFVIDNFNPDTFPVYDEWLRVNMMPAGNVYLLTPMICYQRPIYSDIWQTETNYTSVHFAGNKYLMNRDKFAAI
jgi:GR25 family glycosyltransferase involved in LPS biosynthesis